MVAAAIDPGDGIWGHANVIAIQIRGVVWISLVKERLGKMLLDKEGIKLPKSLHKD